MASTTLTFVETNNDEKPKRTRQTHNKVRTGCVTCKIRRKKCGEEKPFCRRCTSTGRKCDGYETTAPKPTEDEPLPPDSGIDVSSVTALRSKLSSTRSSSPEDRDRLLKLWRPPKSEFFTTDNDFYCFDFFRNRTAPEFTAYFDSTIFRTFMIRACFLFPTVLQAASAVGAVHRRFELGISKQAFEFCAVAARQYRKATECLEADLRSGHPNGLEINMVTSLLLSIFETFQNNYDAALTHMTTGFKQLLRQKLQITHSETQYKSVNIGFESLHKLTDLLERNAPRIFGNKTNILAQPGVDPALDPVPKAFENLSHARDVLITEGQWIWDAWLQLELGNLNKFETQQFHISRLLEWSMAYAEYSKTEKCRSPPQDRQRAQLLKAYREVMYLVLLTQIAFHDPDGKIIVPPCDPPDICTYHKACVDYAERKSALNAHLARCLVLVEGILNEKSYFAYEEHSISLDSGIGPPLYVGQTKCRSTKVRHQITSLLAETALQKKVWDTLGVYSIAEKLSSIEEHAVVAVGAIPAVLDPKWVDITFFLEDGKVLLRHCRQDEYGGLIWTQELAFLMIGF
jgi:Fungal Zn(2)-Cys(6) binuclear cluster domain